MNCPQWFKKQHVTLPAETDPTTSTTTGTSFPDYGAPEDLLTHVTGPWSRWHILVVFVFCGIMIFHGLNLYASQLLIPHHLEFNCSQDGNSDKRNPCYTSNGSRCHTFIFSHRYGNTITEKLMTNVTLQFTLVCDQRVLKYPTANILFSSGLAVGFIILGYLTDRWGRRKVLFFSLILLPLTGVLITSSGSYTFFMIIRFFKGFASSGTALTAVILTCEISSNKWRTFNLALLCLSLAAGHTLLPCIWMILADSMKNILVLSLPQIVLVIFLSVIRESPSWLLCQNQSTRAESVLITVGHFNGHKMPSTFRIRPVQILNVHNRGTVRLFNILQLSRTRWVILALYLTWFLTSFTSGLVLSNIWTQSEDLLETMVFSGISSTISAISCLALCQIMHHKFVIAVTTILACIITCITHVINHHQEFNKYQFMVSDLAVYGLFSMAFFTVWNITPRIFPTEMRGHGTGVAFMIGELSFTAARILSPYIYKNLTVSLITFCFCTISILIFCMKLFYVHNRELPDMLDDSMNFKYAYKPTRWSTLRATSPALEETEVKIVDFERGTSLTLQHLNVPFIFRNKGGPKLTTN